MILVRVHKKIEKRIRFLVFSEIIRSKDGEIPECAHK